MRRIPAHPPRSFVVEARFPDPARAENVELLAGRRPLGLDPRVPEVDQLGVGLVGMVHRYLLLVTAMIGSIAKARFPPAYT